ncbi:hypothetical protein ACIP93_33935 [Streptomyces sp. NPDC088745]|uniref:hypothetical protein n=1 Tax=Streptomyces sp. NPDC088745 TaxID=3365884 RepID=UPI00380DA93E
MTVQPDRLGVVAPSDVLERAERLGLARDALIERIDPNAVPAACRSRFNHVLAKRHELLAGIRDAKSPVVQLVHYRLLVEHVDLLGGLSRLPDQAQTEEG